MIATRASPLTGAAPAGPAAARTQTPRARRGARTGAVLIGAATLLEFVADLDAHAPAVLRDHVLHVLRPAGVAVLPVEQVEHAQRQARPALPVAAQERHVGHRETARAVAGQSLAPRGVPHLETRQELVVPEGDAQVRLRQVPGGVGQGRARGHVLALLKGVAHAPLEEAG